jgi:large subunit ribosomal protein L27
MAHKTGGGNTKNGRDSKSKRLGVKIFLGGKKYVKEGSILVRQKGLDFKPGLNVKLGKDYTLYSKINGYIICSTNKSINCFPDKYTIT